MAIKPIQKPLYEQPKEPQFLTPCPTSFPKNQALKNLRLRRLLNLWLSSLLANN